MLMSFETINSIMKNYDVQFFEYFEEIRANFIRILNEIVDNYTFKGLEMRSLDAIVADLEYLKAENEALRRQQVKRKSEANEFVQNKFAPSPEPAEDFEIKIVEPVVVTIEKSERSFAKSKFDVGNGILKWTNAKDFHTQIPNLTYKCLSQKQLRDFIEELYEAKALYDTGCRKQHQPRETIEQFMYNHLKYKYGLNKIVVEWAFGIIEGVKIFSTSDTDIALFGLVD